MGFRVAFFGYSWTPDLRPDAFQRALIDAFIARGAEVRVVLANYLVAEGFLNGMHPDVSQSRIMKDVKKFDPTLVVSMNRGGLTSAMKAELNVPVVTWLVDDFTHLFDPDGAGSFEGIATSKDPLIVSHHETYGLLKKAVPQAAPFMHFVPSATHFDAFRARPPEKRYEISFVGSYLSLNFAERVFRSAMRDESALTGVYEAMRRLRTDYRHDFVATVQELGLEPLLRRRKLTPSGLKMVLTNVISSHDRLSAVLKTHDLGLALFGNKEWIRPLLLNGENVLRCYQANRAVRSHQDLVDVYQSSRVCFNVTQLQGASALSYRAFDVMASDALLIQPHHDDSDGHAIFGKDWPVPTYRNFDELRTLCQYFLTHEDERLERVRLCHEKIKRGFSFDDRVTDIVRIAGVPTPKPSAQPGVFQLPSGHFHGDWLLPTSQIKRLVRDGMVWFVVNAISRRQRERVANLFSAKR